MNLLVEQIKEYAGVEILPEEVSYNMIAGKIKAFSRDLNLNVSQSIDLAYNIYSEQKNAGLLDKNKHIKMASGQSFANMNEAVKDLCRRHNINVSEEFIDALCDNLKNRTH